MLQLPRCMVHLLYLWCRPITNRLICRVTWKRRRGAKVKREDNLQGNSSFNGLQNMLFLVSSRAQNAKHQMTVLSRFGVHICIPFWVELNVNKVYISQATFFVAVAAYIQHCIYICALPCDFCLPPAAASRRRPCYSNDFLELSELW